MTPPKDLLSTSLRAHLGVVTLRANRHPTTRVLADGTVKHFFARDAKGPQAKTIARTERPVSAAADHSAPPPEVPKTGLDTYLGGQAGAQSSGHGCGSRAADCGELQPKSRRRHGDPRGLKRNLAAAELATTRAIIERRAAEAHPWTGPTAAERLRAVRQRVLARQGASEA